MKVLALTLALLPINPPQTHADASISATTQPQTQPAEHSTRPTIAVGRGALSTVVEGQGYFEPAEPFDLRIRPKVYSGDLIIQTIVPHGASVKKGDVLLAVDPETIDKQLLAAENEVAAAHANLTKVQAEAKIGAEQDALAMKIQTQTTQRAQDEVKWFETVDGPNLLAEADQMVKNSKGIADDQQDELNELKKMYKTDDLTTATADIVVKRAVRSLEQAKFNLKIQTDQSGKIRKETYPARQKVVLDSAKQAEQQLELMKVSQEQGKVLRETGLAAALASTKAADEKFADLKSDKEKLTIHAPADGVVLYGQLVSGGFQASDERALRAGEKVGSSAPIFTFYTPGKLRLHAELPEAKFFSIPKNAKAKLITLAWGEKALEGKCESKTTVPQNTQQGPVYTLLIDCDKADHLLRPGMRANFKIEAPETELAVVVPNSAITDGAVWVKNEDGQPDRRQVVVGRSDGKHTQIKQGLREGEEIFVEAQK